MKLSIKLFLSMASFLSLNFAFGQTTGTIFYTETVKLDFNLPEGMDIGNVDEALTVDKALHFKDQRSVYKDVKNNKSNDQTISNDDGSFQMTIQMDKSEDSYHSDFKNGKTVNQTEFLGKVFIIESPFEKHQWRLTGEKIKYLDFVCQKAEKTIEQDGKAINIVVWFTSEIPLAIGPDNYNQLPGAILMVSKDDGKTEIKATKINFDQAADEIFELPKKGKKVTKEEYEKIVEEKTQEMLKEFDGKKIKMIKG